MQAFAKLAQKNRLADLYLSEWGYLVKKKGFWPKLKSFFGILGSKLRGVFSSWGYFRLVMTQRNPAFLLYGILIVFFIAAAIYVPLKWQAHARSKLMQLDQHVEELHGR